MVWECGLDFSGSGLGPVTGSSEHGNEFRDSYKGGEYFASLSRRILLH
jgi:hypothetical protein